MENPRLFDKLSTRFLSFLFKMLDSVRFISVKSNIFSIITAALVILLLLFIHGLIANMSFRLYAFDNRSIRLKIRQTSQELKITSDNHDTAVISQSRIVHQLDREELGLFESSDLSKRFDSRVRDFFRRNRCNVQIFMTWIAPVDSFGERDFFGLESLFQTNPTSCVIILSTTMDSLKGQMILKPLTNRGFSVDAMSPDLWDLLKNTSAESWLNDIKNGNKDPGEIPLAQNLSNLIRLAVLYRYGGLYLDTDFIALKDLSGLRNSIGAQSVDTNGNWTRLNNAVLVFDKNHPLVYKFMEEFALNFNGNIWGHNGPYLVSRVVNEVVGTGDLNHFTVLPPVAFYPVDWTHIAGFFVQPDDRVGAKWVEAKVGQLEELSYGIHLWNRQSRRFKIEKGSIVWRLISDHCVVCSS